MDPLRKLKLSYSFDTRSRRGTLDGGSVGLLVQDLTKKAKVKDFDYALSLSKDNFLPCRFYDHDNHAMVYEGSDTSLVDYVMDLKANGINPVMTYKVWGTEKTVKYIPKEYTKLLFGMIRFLVELHSIDEKSVGTFSLSHFEIKGDEVNYWGLKFKNMTEDTRQRDFKFLNEVIVKLFENRCPSILNDLLNRMTQHYPCLEDEQNLLKHLAIQSSSARLAFMRDAFDKKDGLEDNEENVYAKALENMGNNGGWGKIFKEDEESKIFGPITSCYIKNYKKKKVMPGTSRRKVLTNEPTNRKLLNFIRILASHLRSDIRQAISEDEELSDQDVELSILAFFELPLLKFNRALSEAKILHLFI